MRKQYQKPTLTMETFQVNEDIAASCLFWLECPRYGNSQYVSAEEVEEWGANLDNMHGQQGASIQANFSSGPHAGHYQDLLTAQAAIS